jgi:DNA-binding IclR family transcriptional regulator
MQGPTITINGTQLSRGQAITLAITIRLVISEIDEAQHRNLMADMQETLQQISKLCGALK